MKKIGIMCNLMTSYGGIQTCVISLIKGLNQQGITPVLIADQVPKTQLWEEQGLSCEYKKINFSFSAETYQKYSKFLSFIWEFIFFFKTSWLKRQYDFVYIFEPNTLIDDDQKHLFYLSMSPRAHGYSQLGFLSRQKDHFYRFFLKRIHPVFEYQNYSCVINSHYTAGMFYDYFGKKLAVVNPPNTVEDKVPAQIIKKEKTVVFLSRLVPLKKVEKIIDLATSHPDYTFYVLGATEKNNDSYITNIKKNIKVLGLQNIRVLENQPYAVVIEYLTLCEYYVFFAENEHFGITTVEAILFGCIPFVHNSGGQKEIVPFEQLRFDNSDIEVKFTTLIMMDDSKKAALLNSLKGHMSNFREEVYIEKMLSYLPLA